MPARAKRSAPPSHTQQAEKKRNPSGLEKVLDVPKMVVSTSVKSPPSFDASATHSFSYEAIGHKDTPHVVKFSGGRSSGMLLFLLLENEFLKPERGDVVIFNNTSAEHPETYRFTAKCKSIVEKRYGVPFFWLEFQTYEDARDGEWVRLPTYRLVNPVPWSTEEPHGYHWKGETFEEVLSFSGFVPNQFQRTCTKKLKLDTTRLFLQDWFACKASIEHLGHYSNKSRMSSDEMYARHQRNQGKVPREIFLQKKEYVCSRPVFRPEQLFSDFSQVVKPIENQYLTGKKYGNRAFFGENGVEYLAFIGLRYDEMHRVIRTRRRNSSDQESGDYEGEHVYMPLADLSVTREDVNEFWTKQEWDLSLPEDAGLSNCVYCFLKGMGGLQKVHQRMQNEDDSLADSPCDINWWKRIEGLYGRDLVAEKRDIKSKVNGNFIGFFGTKTGFSYSLLSKSSNDADLSEFSDTVLPCDCTD